MNKNEKKTSEGKKKNKKNTWFTKKRKIALIVTTAAVVVAIVITSLIGAYFSSNKYLKKFVAMESENIKIDASMLSYFFYDGFEEFMNLYGDNHETYQVKRRVPLKRQEFKAEGYDTWYDYFLGSAQKQVKEFVTIAEKAKADGIALSQEEVDNLKIRASRIDYSKYPGVSEKEAQACLELTALALKYKDYYKTNFEVLDEKIDEELKVSKTNYITADYRKYVFTFTGTGEDAEQGDFPQDEAKKHADNLKKCTTDEEFTKWLDEFLIEQYDYSDADREKIINESIFKNEKYPSLAENPILWTFDESRKAGDTQSYTDEENGTVTVYLVVTPAHYDESETRTVSHILFRESTYGSDAKTKAAAEKVLEEIKKSSDVEKAMAEYALGYSEDAGSCFVGGLYKSFSAKEMMPEFSDWCFDESRTKGELGLVKSEYGYHIIYYIDKGDTKYIATATETLKSNAFSSLYTTLSPDATVTINEENCRKVK